ncbi:hypothetical protein V8G54_001462 [Vigna mungo]|uniref:Uncharacterized protein n=1 Tax=Vigna mungo TaxID=3915 RepID=A0AAQ3P7E3_VIGMU
MLLSCLKIMNLNVTHLMFLEIGVDSVDQKLAPFVCPIFGRVLIIYQLLQRLHLSFLCREEKEWNRKSFFFRVHHHSMLWTLKCIVTPNLKNITKVDNVSIWDGFNSYPFFMCFVFNFKSFNLIL